MALDEEESLLEDELEEEAALAAGEGAGPKSVGETQAPRHSTAGQERLKSDLEQEAKVCVCVCRQKGVGAGTVREWGLV